MPFFSYLLHYFYFDSQIWTYWIVFTIDIFIIYPLFAYFKWQLLICMGMNLKERITIFSNRKNGFKLKYFIYKYGDRKLRIVDGLSRKLLHISSGILQLLFFNLVVRDTRLSLQISLLNSLLLIFLSAISYSSNKIFNIAGIMYGATSRIRDGVDGRRNSFIARLWFINLFPLAFIEYIAKQNIADETRLIFFSFFIFLPLTIGDALGEILGTIWGKQRIRVWGIGEINRKSILGTVSVFLGSLVPLLLIVVSQGLSFHWWLLCLVVSTITTVIELIVPRGTDNFFIPLMNALICLIFIVYFSPI